MIRLGVRTSELVYAAWSHSKTMNNFLSNFAVLDSGAEVHVSGHQSDFDSLSPKPDIALQGIDGAVGNGNPVAYRGWFKKNNLGISLLVCIIMDWEMNE